MKPYTQGVLERAARLAALEQSAALLESRRPFRSDLRALIGAAVAALLMLYPGISAGAALMM